VFLPFRTHDQTQPTKNKKISTQPNPWVDPTHGQLCEAPAQDSGWNLPDIIHQAEELSHRNVVQDRRELSYRQQIARQLRTQYAEGIYMHKYYTVTLKSLSVTQGHIETEPLDRSYTT